MGHGSHVNEGKQKLQSSSVLVEYARIRYKASDIVAGNNKKNVYNRVALCSTWKIMK